MGDEQIDARASQGFIQDPQSTVEQQFGDRQTASTDGGDYAGQNIDKRNNTFIINLLGKDPADAISQQAFQKLIQTLEQITDGQSVKRAYQEQSTTLARVS